MLRLDRTRQAGDYLEWKVRIFTVGAVLAAAGMYLQEDWLVGVATVVLAVGVLLRFLPGAPPDTDAPDAAEGAEQLSDRDAGPPSA